jgi:Sec-independent protein translocase protein TatA
MRNGVVILIIVFLFVGIFASPQMSPTATKIMREIKQQYKTEKAQMFLSAHLRDKNLTNEQISDIRERMNYFFDSNTFLETGAAYLTALFNENDLSNILTSIMRGDFFDNRTGKNRQANDIVLAKKIQQLFDKLDPYLYMYLQQNIMQEPGN